MRQLPNNTDRLTAWMVRLPLRHQFQSSATDLDHRLLILVRIESGAHAGWGEAAPVPGHTAESLTDVWQNLRDAPSHGLAAAALAQAHADLQARSDKAPLWQHLGGNGPVWASAAIGVSDDGQPDRAQLEFAANTGYRHAKLKITAATDAAGLKELRTRYPRMTLGLDANGSLGTEFTEQVKAIDSLGFAFIEQPGPAGDIDAHSRLRQRLNTPVALDESADSIASIEEILAKGAADIVNLKAGRFGTEETLELAKRITATGSAVRLGGLLESGVGRAHSVALATCREFSWFGDIAGSDLYFDNDLVVPSWRIADGTLEPTNQPGIGVDVDVTAVERFAIDTFLVG